MEALDWTAIKGFSADGRTFGDARCIPCRIGTSRAALSFPGGSHYPEDIVEVIAAVALRGALGVKENDTVNVEVAYD